ncbi:MAG: helix-turn-helix domain-containing protein [Candidatus Palauibacterales bacterium]|nr:helix-turn-helix domain-containing protein [Candidatus Palauibacterales bacterium]
MVEANQNGTDRDAEEAILEAAHEVFVRRGTAGARMREIADAAGVNQALLHYYFRSKEGLARAVFGRAARRLMPAVLQALGSDLSLDEKVERVIATEMEVLGQHPYLPGYILCELAHHPERADQLVEAALGEGGDAAGQAVVSLLGRQLEEAREAGTIAPIDPRQFVVNLLALAIFPFAARPLLEIMLGLDEVGYGEFLEERRQQLAGFFLRGLRS